jgi:putative transposase
MMARRKLGSKRRNRAKIKTARCRQYSANVRNDFAQKTSRTLVNSEMEVFVFEDLKIKNMTKAPKPKKDENGNGARAKAALNKGILDSVVSVFFTRKYSRVDFLSKHHTMAARSMIVFTM